MIDIEIHPHTAAESLKLLQEKIGGTFTEESNKCILNVDNDIAKGRIIYSEFDWGVHYMDLKIKFYEDFTIHSHSDDFNPLRFLYVMKGHIRHRFGVDNTERKVERFHSLIFTNNSEGDNFLVYPVDTLCHINLIQIERKSFLKRKNTNIASLNKTLHDVFVDKDHDNRFSHYGSLNLQLGDFINEIDELESEGEGMVNVLKTEALVYQILSFHIQQHNKFYEGVPLPTSLSNRELKIIRKLGNAIIKNPSFAYNLDDLSQESALSQAKLQEGFKFLYHRTVTEYVRHIRLEKARDLLNTDDLNISQVVYSIGFTSRSYFSKIFKEKYNITPNEYRKNVQRSVGSGEVTV